MTTQTALTIAGLFLTTLIFAVGIIWQILKGLLSKVVIDMTTKITEIETQFKTLSISLEKFGQEIKKEFYDFKLEIVKGYATAETVEKAERDNHASHATIWSELNLMKERIKGVETVQKQCPGCNRTGSEK